MIKGQFHKKKIKTFFEIFISRFILKNALHVAYVLMINKNGHCEI